MAPTDLQWNGETLVSLQSDISSDVNDNNGIFGSENEYLLTYTIFYAAYEWIQRLHDIKESFFIQQLNNKLRSVGLSNLDTLNIDMLC